MPLLNDLININLSGATKKTIAEYIWIGGSGMQECKESCTPRMLFSTLTKRCGIEQEYTLLQKDIDWVASWWIPWSPGSILLWSRG